MSPKRVMYTDLDFMNPFHEKIQKPFHHSALSDLVFPSEHEEVALPAWFEVTKLATASVGAAVAALCRLHNADTGEAVNASINQRLCNLWFSMTLAPIDFSIASLWDSIAGDYRTNDGWIRLHTNAPHHKAAVLKVLCCDNTLEAVAQSVRQWKGEGLETAIINADGCAAQMRSFDDWNHHPHGIFLKDEPLIQWGFSDSTNFNKVQSTTKPSPLSGIKVLDLTRVLAGPIASRFLAGFGAQVLRLDPPDWDEPCIIPEVTLGKRCAQINLKTAQGKQQFIHLLKDADVLLHGYRADALEHLGFSAAELSNINANLINVSLNAYGWTGPWRNRRGFDSLMQMSSGIAHYGMCKSGADKPVPLPVQALDHATGYLLAGAVIQAIELRAHHNIVAKARCSLAATSQLLQTIPFDEMTTETIVTDRQDYSTDIEHTSWGTGRRIKFPVMFDQFKVSWPNGATRLRSSKARWE